MRSAATTRAWAVDIENGRVRWELPGTPSLTGRLGAAGPAISSDLAIFPFSSGELVAAFRQGGVRLWSSAVSGQRQGRAYAAVTDIAADPVISGNTVYAGNVSGRSVALSLGNGQRIWSANYGAIGPMQVAGGSVFLVSDQNQLVRLDAATGETVWETELPLFRRLRPTRRDAVFAHYGPRLAGGRLLVASDDNQIRAYSPETGALIGTTPLPAGASTGMAVVNRTLYVVTGNGQLHAFR
jgi:outer membrane protein assembly factor BamB